MKQLPIRISDFKDLIDGNFYYVDKTLLIEELLQNTANVVLVPRPRRFGKTLNLSMVHYFFEKSAVPKDYLFVHTEIWQTPARAHQAQYPVIFLTFKNIAEDTFQGMYNSFAFTIAREFKRHNYILSNNSIASFDRERFTRILEEKPTEIDLSRSLEFLSQLLYQYHKQKVMILIDEYDAPVQAAYINGFYDKLINFLKLLLTPALKDNIALERGLLTGVFTLAKAGLFSGLNNLEVLNITSDLMADKFGFTDSETSDLLDYYEFQNSKDSIAEWYNGYKFGNHAHMYNPWSVLNCVRHNGKFDKYWANTSDNIVLKSLIAKAPAEIKSDLELLLSNKSIKKRVVDTLIFPDLYTQPDLLWSLLLFAGYLTYTDCSLDEDSKTCTLLIPNREIILLFKELIGTILKQSLPNVHPKLLLEVLTQGSAENLTRLLQEFVLNSMSSFDISATEPENSYHLFVLGMVVMLPEFYEVKSNRESGYGRYDILLIPKKAELPGIIIEFKVAKSADALEETAQKALDQIKAKKYAQDLTPRNIRPIYSYGIAFSGKKVFIKAIEVTQT